MGVKRWLVGLVAAGSMLGLAGVSVAPAVAGELAHERLAGPSGVETSLAVAKHTWGTDWKVVYVASNRNPVDALPAATIGDGPVVLTDGKSLNLGGVKPGKIMILGGTGAVPQAIEDQAKGQGVEVVRLAGADRNATAVAIAKQWVKVNGTPKNVYITKNAGSGSPDAVAASVLRDGPILTFTSDASAAALPGVVSELKAGKVTALGGGAVVPDSILNTAAGGKATARLAGANRYETAFTIAKYAKAQKSGSVVYLASGTALKDAMVAGAAKDGVILLSPPNGEGVKAKADALGASKLIIIGGTGVMPDTTVQAATTGVIPKKPLSDLTLQDIMAMPDLNLSSLKTLKDTDIVYGDRYYFFDETRENLYQLSCDSRDGCTGISVIFPKGKERPVTKEQMFSIAPTPEYFKKVQEEMQMNNKTYDKFASVLFAPSHLYMPWIDFYKQGFDCSNMKLSEKTGNYCSAISILPDGVKIHTDYGNGMTCGLLKNGIKCFGDRFGSDKDSGWAEGQTVRVQTWSQE
ncbi:cell wall-binding repeat-containing protein [Mobiluncus sp.]|uniref:cell wall-binding repeat-containing protein n=1 Tax=Mobiluncus sp. TaxID=47293 RepID=UPI002A917B69|nr:cell wall-binding repeat-containing protein [Mobiluncus sp.]